MEQQPPQGGLESGVLISSQGSPSVEQALARLSGEVGKKQRDNGEVEQRKRIEPGPLTEKRNSGMTERRSDGATENNGRETERDEKSGNKRGLTPLFLCFVAMRDKNELVVKSNRLVEASYRLTLVEQQIILFAICRAREEQLGLTADTLVTITAADFSAMFGTHEDEVYRQLKEAMNTLYARSVTLYDTHPETGKERISKVRWVSRASYIDGAGAVQIRFAVDMAPYITRLEREFTAYRLEKIGKLSSVHAVRLYELLVQYLSLGKREIEIDWLKTTLQVSEAYPRIESFKRSVIDVATQQINAHTDITTSYTQRKTGRNVTHLNFKIDAKEAAPKVVKRPSLTRAYVEKHALPGESWEVARERLRAERGRA